MPGVTVTLRNDATGVAVTCLSDARGHYIFDFVEPGTYSISAELVLRWVEWSRRVLCDMTQGREVQLGIRFVF